MTLDETLTFLQALYHGQQEGYLTFTAIHPSKRCPTPSRHLPISDKDAVHQALHDLLRANAQGWGAYFSVALRGRPLDRWHRGGQGDLLALPALFADLDGELSASFASIREAGLAGLPPPSAMVGSGRGLHLYWFITPTRDFEATNRILAGLAQGLGGDTVSSTNAMRLPGSRNTKAGVNRACKLLWLAEQRRYNLEDFAPYQASIPVPQLALQPVRDTPDQLNADLVACIVEVLVREHGGFLQKNGWIGALCPCGHVRDAPGKHFGFLPHKGVARCFGRHQRILLKDLCTLLGVDPARYGGLYHSITN
jgi:hypothetical protein